MIRTGSGKHDGNRVEETLETLVGVADTVEEVCEDRWDQQIADAK